MSDTPDDSFRSFIKSPAGITLVVGTVLFLTLAAAMVLALCFGKYHPSDDVPRSPTLIFIDGQPFFI